MFFFLILGTGSLCSAQVKKSVRSGKYSVPHISHNKARIVCPIFVESQYPYQGIGFKVGDPFALTYKFYPTKHWSFAVDGGKAASGLYNSYYRGLFHTLYPDTLSTDKVTHEKSTMTYYTHKVLSDWFLETKFLYQWDAEKISKGMMLYAGLGWQWRKTTLQYEYNYQNSDHILRPSPSFGNFKTDRFTFGPVAIIGFEYSYFSLPVSAFIEVELYTDALIDPGYQRFQGGVGLRYVF